MGFLSSFAPRFLRHNVKVTGVRSTETSHYSPRQKRLWAKLRSTLLSLQLSLQLATTYKQPLIYISFVPSSGHLTNCSDLINKRCRDWFKNPFEKKKSQDFSISCEILSPRLRRSGWRGELLDSYMSQWGVVLLVRFKRYKGALQILLELPTCVVHDIFLVKSPAWQIYWVN